MTTSPSASASSSLHVLCPACRKINRVPVERLTQVDRATCGHCHRPLFSGHPVEVDEAGFRAYLGHDELPLLVDMWAPWCGPCRTMAPHFERAATLLEPRMRLLKLNVDLAQATAAEYAVRSIPSLLLFHRGKLLDRVAGALDGDTLVRWARSRVA